MTATSSVRYARAAGDRVPLGVFGVLVSASPATPGGDRHERSAPESRARPDGRERDVRDATAW